MKAHCIISLNVLNKNQKSIFKMMRILVLHKSIFKKNGLKWIARPDGGKERKRKRKDGFLRLSVRKATILWTNVCSVPIL